MRIGLVRDICDAQFLLCRTIRFLLFGLIQLCNWKKHSHVSKQKVLNEGKLLEYNTKTNKIEQNKIEMSFLKKSFLEFISC